MRKNVSFAIRYVYPKIASKSPMNEKKTAWNLFVEEVLQRIVLLIVYVTFL